MNKRSAKVVWGTLTGLAMFALVMCVASSGVFAEPGDGGQPAAKVTARFSEVTALQSNSDWTTLMATKIKTANQKDLFINVSLESILLTSTTAKSKGGNKDTAVAEAGVAVRIIIDGDETNLAYPGEVTFAKRTQTLSATFQGLIEDCVDAEGHVILDDACLQNEEIELVLETMSANSFNFIMDNLGSGTHDVAIQVKTTSAALEGTAEANALIGKGSATVQEVRLTQGEDIEL